MYVPTTQTPDLDSIVLRQFKNENSKAVAVPETFIDKKLWESRPTDIVTPDSITRLPKAPFTDFSSGMVLVPFWDYTKMVSHNERLMEECTRLREANQTLMADCNQLRLTCSRQKFEYDSLREDIKFMLGRLNEAKETLFHLEERLHNYAKPQ